MKEKTRMSIRKAVDLGYLDDSVLFDYSDKTLLTCDFKLGFGYNKSKGINLELNLSLHW
ncbi:MAG: hypothetical protein ACRCVW_02585 [Brevinema sp.]